MFKKSRCTGLGIRKELRTENHQHPERYIIYQDIKNRKGE